MEYETIEDKAFRLSNNQDEYETYIANKPAVNEQPAHHEATVNSIPDETVLSNRAAVPSEISQSSVPIETEDDVALVFSENNASVLRYVAPWGKWMQWGGVVWRNDDTLAVYDSVRRLCRVACSGDPKTRKAMLNAKTVSAVERMVRSDRRHAATVDQWDNDDWILNTPGGIVNLITGEIAVHDPWKYCTQITAVSPSEECPAWIKFLNDVTDGNQELIDFLQRVAGYSATGLTREHALFFYYGTGGNGKGTFLNALHDVLQDYVTTASMDVFTESKHDRHPTELADLRGARLVIAQETDEGRKWAEAKLKALTGGDKITARYMRQDFFTFLPKFTLMVAGNHKPSLRNVDEAIRRRLHLIPFVVTIPKKDRDPDLPDKLKAEWGGILQWIIDGCLKYQAQGLKPPKIVTEATDKYFEDEDTMQQWISDCCEAGIDYWETPSILFNSWKEYANAANFDVGTQKELKSRLENAGYQWKRSGPRGRHHEGLKVKATVNAYGVNIDE